MGTSSRLRLHIAEDGLLATAVVNRGPAVTPEELEAALREAGIVAGVEREGCAELAMKLAEPDFHCAEWVVARGRACEPSCDAWIEPVFAQGVQAGHVREDGTIDYHDRELLKAVQNGEVVGVFHPLERGSPGQKVDGTAILPITPSELRVRLLPGVQIGEDRQLRATRNGVVLYVPGKSLDVVDRHVHEGAVDMHSGNLSMQGSLVIKGDVLHPFSVVTSGDLEVMGSVDVATVIAGGSLRIQRGVRGGEGSKVHAAGDLSAHHAQAVELCSGGLLTVGEAVNSHLVGSEVRVSGRLRGGLVEAELHVVVHEAGAANGTPTELVAAKPLQLPSDEANQLLAAEKAGPKSRAGGRPPGSERHPKDSRAGSGPHSMSSAELQHLTQLEHRREELLYRATIEIQLGYPGVTIRIGPAHVTLTEPVHSLRYHLDRESQTLQVTKL